MEKSTQKIIENVRKLLSMAADNANEHEAANAARMAEKLLRKYNLSMADITPEEAKSNVVDKKWTHMKWTVGKAPVWVMNLCIGIADAYDVYVVWSWADSNDHWVAKRQSNLTFVGAEADVEVTSEIFTYLYKTVIRLTDAHFKANPATYSPRTEKKAYRQGITDRLRMRLAEMTEDKEAEFEEAAETSTTGTNLMVIKKDAIGEYLGKPAEYAESTRQESTDNTAYTQGWHKGGTVSLNKQVGNSATTKIY